MLSPSPSLLVPSSTILTGHKLQTPCSVPPSLPGGKFTKQAGPEQSQTSLSLLDPNHSVHPRQALVHLIPMPQGREPTISLGSPSCSGLLGCSHSSASCRASPKQQFCACTPETTGTQGRSPLSPPPFPLCFFLGVCSSPCHLEECSRSWQGWLHVGLGKHLP